MDVAEASILNLVSIEEIDGSFVPRAHPAAVEVTVGDELVVVRGLAFILNRTAALVWNCLDGSGSIDDLVADLSEATGTDETTIRHDVLALIHALAERGLLEGIAPPPPPEGTTAWSAPTSVAVGDELEDFVLPDLEGRPVRLTDLRERQVLLVNWSPTCGYCLKIAPELGELEAGLRQHGVTLAFVASGDADANRAVMNEAGLEALVLLKADGVDPFGTFGTPAGYLLDTDGTVAVAMAYGADQVPVLARRVAGVELATENVDGVAYLPAAAAVCGDGGGGAVQSPGTSWTGIRSFRLAGFHVGVRHNSAETEDVLGRLFPGLTVDDPRTPANYAVALYPSDGRSRELNLLVKGATQLVRSRSRARVLQALLGHLSVELAPRDPTLLHLNATSAVLHGAEGLLLPPGLVAWVKQLQPRLARRGIQLVDLPWASVDTTTCSLVVPEPEVEHDPRVLEELHDQRLGSELPHVRPSRYPLRAWFAMLPPTEDDGSSTLTPAGAVAVAAGLLLADREDYPAALAQAATLASRVPAYQVTAEGPESLVADIEAAIS